MATSPQVDSSGETQWWDVKHVTYHSIEPTTNSRRVEMFANDKLLDKCEWVVTEKIHGSNFSFITNGKQIICANRSRPLLDSEVYYGFQTVKEKYSSNILKLWEIMSSKNLIHVTSNTNEKVVIIFGELFGGRYSHPDVKPIQSALMCQYGIDYCPQNDFMAFDIFDGKYYLNYDIMIEILEESGLPFLKPLFRGSYDQVVNYDPEFTTTIPSLFGLPPLPTPNKSEGVIIKPVLALRSTQMKRVILKIKSSDFVERVRIKKREFKRNERNERKDQFEPMNEIFEELSTFINENRVNSVVSKFGPIVTQLGGDQTKENDKVNQVTKLLYEDAFTDFCKEDNLKEKFEKLLKSQQDIIKQKGNTKALNVVKEYVKKIKCIYYLDKNNNNNNNNNHNNEIILGESGDEDTGMRWVMSYYR